MTGRGFSVDGLTLFFVLATSDDLSADSLCEEWREDFAAAECARSRPFVRSIRLQLRLQITMSENRTARNLVQECVAPMLSVVVDVVTVLLVLLA